MFECYIDIHIKVVNRDKKSYFKISVAICFS